MNQLEKQASDVLQKHGKKLPKRWRGGKEVWHAWHSPYLAYFLTWRGFLERIIEIENNKPENEKPLRFRLINPVVGKFSKTKASAAWDKAYAVRRKAYAVRRKASAAWVKADAVRRKASAAWDKAYAVRRKAYAAWERAYAAWFKADAARDKADADTINKLHAKECPNCTWNKRAIVFSAGVKQ